MGEPGASSDTAPGAVTTRARQRASTLREEARTFWRHPGPPWHHGVPDCCAGDPCSLHHFRNERYWFGITTHLADHVLGTFPAKEAVPVSSTCGTLGASWPEQPGQPARRPSLVPSRNHKG